MTVKQTERGFDRVVNFSDAVVAIAITLLVLPLIDLLGDEDAQTLGEIWRQYSDSFFAFFIAFLVLAGYWRLHHQIFEYVGSYDGWLMRLNFLWLMLVVLLPFISASYSASTRPGAPGDEDATPFVVYMCSLALMSLLMGLMLVVIRLRPQLRAEHTEDSDLDTWRFWGFMAYELVVALVAWFWLGQDAAWLLLGLVVLNWLFVLRARRAGMPTMT